jgi:glucose-6-phosphate 1-dehydrogenase
MTYTIVIFGANGDLAIKKICPSLKELRQKYQLKIIGIDRTFADNYQAGCNQVDHVLMGDLQTDTVYEKLKTLINNHESVLFYCAVPYSVYVVITEHLYQHQLLVQNSKNFRRIAYEKPFGKNYRTAKKINQKIAKICSEDQIYRIDHYLARPIVQNIFYTRFTNKIFEAIWHKDNIESIAVLFAESESILSRGDYYEQAGVVNDVVQNHMLQILALILMQYPDNLNPLDFQKNKQKILKKIKINKAIFGQYEGYTNEINVAKNSQIPTFNYLQLECADKKWAGLPIIFWSGKNLGQKKSLVQITFKPTKCLITNQCPLPKNLITIYIVPEDGFKITINTKDENQHDKVIPINFTHLDHNFTNAKFQIYASLIEDILLGNRLYDVNFQEIELCWRIADQISEMQKSIAIYKPKSLGPDEALNEIKKFNLLDLLKKELT